MRVVIPGDRVHGHEDFQSVIGGAGVSAHHSRMVCELLQQMLPAGAVGLQVVEVQHDDPSLFP